MLVPVAAVADPVHPEAAGILRVLGPRAVRTLAPARAQVPGGAQLGALVAIPRSETAASLGVEPFAPGIGRVSGTPERLIAFSQAHPGVHMEVTTPLHTLMSVARGTVQADRAYDTLGADGAGTLVGVADTGIDVSHPEFLDETGHSRIAWLLDMSVAPAGLHPDLEERFGIKNADGKVVAGAVYSAKEIDQLIADKKPLPNDAVGHGTHVSSIAAGDGDDLGKRGLYRGMAPKARLIVAGLGGTATGISNDDLVRGVSFVFDRADAEKQPVAVNLSLGGDFGPHDGTTLWEQALASFVGPTHPGRALVAAAGNSGSIGGDAIHQSVHVASGATVRVPITTEGASDGGVQVWVTLRGGANLKIGLDSPSGTWISPIGDGQTRGKKGDNDDYEAGVIYGSTATDSPVPAGSRGAVVLWSGKWPKGTYYVTFTGEGTADLYLGRTGDVQTINPATFAAGLREGTINLPGTHPSILSVGCTVNRPNWVSIAGGKVGVRVPVLDAAGGMVDASKELIPPTEGDACWFSSAGPNVNGVAKPEISAPGAGIIAAMSSGAPPGSDRSMFTTSCPPVHAGQNDRDPRCFQIDETHAVAMGTSMSAPMVTGAIALLLQRDPTLTQDKITALIQAGAHRFRPTPNTRFEDQGGPGELDVVGALDALEQTKNPSLVLPSVETSWIALGADYAAADGSTPLTAILELRGADGQHRADQFEEARLQPRVEINGTPIETAPTVARRGPGLWSYTVNVPAGRGGARMLLGATFDGADIVTPKVVPVSADLWVAHYPSSAKGGCTVAMAGMPSPSYSWLVWAGGAFAALGITLRRASGANRGAPKRHRPDRTAG
ncbi:S8 family serine peptidase [Pendulispora rubella]|uniref:S8 family serine peptidase n=1 Tax=Pendulispora rubella TaxID=2741070 RepID=A0ABZ2L0U0_9BACT